MSKYVEVRGVKIGEGVPKICVPIVGKTKEEILAAARSFEDVALDVVEWRVDWFEGVFDFAQVEDVLKDLRPALGETPILFTFRTSKEGGEKAIEADAYAELNKKAAATGLVDLVDVEAFTGDTYVEKVVKTSHECGVKVIASNHDFRKTPPKAELISRMRKMQELGADIPKIAVMPQSSASSQSGPMRSAPSASTAHIARPYTGQTGASRKPFRTRCSACVRAAKSFSSR